MSKADELIKIVDDQLDEMRAKDLKLLNQIESIQRDRRDNQIAMAAIKKAADALKATIKKSVPEGSGAAEPDVQTLVPELPLPTLAIRNLIREKPGLTKSDIVEELHDKVKTKNPGNAKQVLRTCIRQFLESEQAKEDAQGRITLAT